MKFSRNFNDLVYKSNNNTCFKEDCYCRPFNNPMEIRYALTLEAVQKYLCDDSIKEFELLDIISTPIDTYTPTSIMGLFDINQHANILFCQLVNQPPLECFVVELYMVVYSDIYPAGKQVSLFTEPYCQIGESCVQYFEGSYDADLFGGFENMRATLSNGCTIGMLDCKKIFLNIAAPIPQVGVWGWFDTSWYDGAEIIDINGVPLVANNKDCRTAKQCGNYFRIASNKGYGLDCNNNFYSSGLVNMGGFILKNLCGEQTYTIKGAIEILPNAVTTKFAGDSCYPIGRTAKKSIKIYSSNSANIATWALNEIGVILSGKDLIIKGTDKYSNADDNYIFQEDSFFAQPVANSGNKYLTAELTSCDCNNYFVC